MNRQTEDMNVPGKEIAAVQLHTFKEAASADENISGLRYTIFDPTGNITILVEDEVPVPDQPEVAAQLMKRHPQAEQVGFFRATTGAAANSETASARLQEDETDRAHVHARLRMAGGEFCGNATMCAAALYLLRSKADDGQHPASPSEGFDSKRTAEVRLQVSGAARPVEVRLQVSGAARPVEVRLQEISAGCYSAGVHMPPPLDILTKEFTFAGIQAALPIVMMEGISHIVIESDSPFYPLLQDRPAAEQAIRLWCESLKADGLGLMFLDTAASRLTPLVFIPGSDTVFWENSCASGTAATGMFLAKKAGGSIRAAFTELGGKLRVESAPVSDETWLYGTVQMSS